jgi:tetratricopeptide (TPR) repeat protein
MSSDPAGAADAYARMAASGGAQGSSIANIGLADLAIYQGRSGDAVGLLRAGLAADEKRKDTAYRATKHLILAEAYEAEGNTRLALQEVRAALQLGSRDEAVLVPAVRLFVRVGKVAEAEAIVSQLNQSLEAHSRAYGSMIAGEIAAQRKRTVDAVGEFRSSVKLTDLWLARFGLGVTYVQAGYHAEALSELELCMKRRGEASAVFLDDVPSVRYLATLPYWLGRAQEGVGLVPAAAESYKSYVQNRAAAARDPLLTDARRRLKTLQGN